VAAFPDDAAQLAMIRRSGAGIRIAFAAFVGWPLLTAWPLLSLLPSLLLLLVLVLAITIAGIWLGYRRWKYSEWKRRDRHASSAAGCGAEILVPRHAWHLDIERGQSSGISAATLIITPPELARMRCARLDSWMPMRWLARCAGARVGRHDDVL
jgi:hypothetical protein